MPRPCESREQISSGFAPLATRGARILILGSLPGRTSLAAQEYYAHQQNAFWRIMEAVFDIKGTYSERCRALLECNIAVWDVLQASVRPGSMDADIQRATAVANDFGSFLNEHSHIESILFNGKKAEQLFLRMVPPEHYRGCRVTALPSTSPAFAAMPFAAKLSAWQEAIAVHG
jgi:hypoxanthine-DNA glycosylase